MAIVVLTGLLLAQEITQPDQWAGLGWQRYIFWVMLLVFAYLYDVNRWRIDSGKGPLIG